MNIIDTLTARLHSANGRAGVALIAECGERVYTIYEAYWVGTYCEFVRRSIDIGWAYACGENIDAAEIETCTAEIKDLLNFYLEDETIDVLAAVITVVLRILQSLTPDENECCLAVARGLLSTLNAAQAAEAMTNQRTGHNTTLAMAEEKAWQQSALAIFEQWKGVAKRNMFEQLNNKPPLWFKNWEKLNQK